jgi:hypothetical protein
MLKYVDPPYALWSIWHQLSTLQHWLVYTLCVLCLYAGFCVVSTISRLHSIKHRGMDEPAARHTIVVLQNRCANLRHAMLAWFYLFGIILFASFQFVARFIMGNDIPGVIIGTFVLDSAFATNIFAVLLVLHLAQWFVSIRLSRYSDGPLRSGPSAPSLGNNIPA